MLDRLFQDSLCESLLLLHDLDFLRVLSFDLRNELTIAEVELHKG